MPDQRPRPARTAVPQRPDPVASRRRPLDAGRKSGSGAILLVFLGLLVGAVGGWVLLDRLAPTDRQTGLASWYGPGFYGRPTASGVTYTGADLTAAHRALPLGTKVRVTNLENGRRVVVVVDDRGPYIGGRVIDLSAAAAERLDMVRDGVVRVRVEVVGQAEETKA